MKDLFSWRLPPSESDFADLWENAVFVFDTNFLLDLYRGSHSTAEDFLNILKHLEKRIWLPHQVVSEFLNRREEIIDSKLKSFQKAITVIDKWKEDWWYKKEGKIISPHFELRREFKEQVDRSFWMYQTNRFLEIAKEKLEIEVSQGSIEEANIIAEAEITKEQVTPEALRSFPQRQANDSRNKMMRLLQHHRNRQDRLTEQLQYRPVYENQLIQVLQQNQIDNERANRFIKELSKIRNNKDGSDPLNLM
jgi:hypothetical protein